MSRRNFQSTASLLASLLAALALGCSSAPNTTADAEQGGPGSDVDSGLGDDDAAAPGDGGTGDLCAPPPKASKCKTDSAWVRGVAHFDPSKLTPGSKPVLRVVLRHDFALLAGEEKIGGRLHGWTNVPIADASKGEVPFAIDMCGLGASMWSEENGVFHLILILDENGNNNLDEATSNATAVTIGTADANELVKMTDVDVSCHAPSNCLDITMDCTGPSCTTFEPVTSCTKKEPGCDSDSSFCK